MTERVIWEAGESDAVEFRSVGRFLPVSVPRWSDGVLGKDAHHMIAGTRTNQIFPWQKCMRRAATQRRSPYSMIHRYRFHDIFMIYLAVQVKADYLAT